MILIILKLFVLQIIAYSLVVYFLKRVLERQLIETALQKLDMLKGEEFSPQLTVEVAYYRSDLALERKVSRIIQKRAGFEVPVKFTIDKKMWGGMLVKTKTSMIDCSLFNRLKEGGFVK